MFSLLSFQTPLSFSLKVNFLGALPMGFRLPFISFSFWQDFLSTFLPHLLELICQRPPLPTLLFYRCSYIFSVVQWVLDYSHHTHILLSKIWPRAISLQHFLLFILCLQVFGPVTHYLFTFVWYAGKSFFEPGGEVMLFWFHFVSFTLLLDPFLSWLSAHHQFGIQH